jgi:tetratricopeptide (TPR) repeat protein
VDRRLVLAHVTRCPSCQAAADEVWWGQASPPGDELFSRLIEKLETTALALKTEKEEAEPLLRHLLSQPPMRRHTLIRNSKSYRNIGLCQALLDTVRPAVFDDPHDAVDRAQLALEVLQESEPTDIHTHRSLTDTQARAHAELANALRAANDLAAAEAEFEAAYGALDAGSGDPDLRAEIDYLHAALLGTRRQCAAAHRRIDSAIRWFKRCDDSHRLGRALLSRAWLYWVDGRLSDAIATAEGASDLLEAGREPDVELAARQACIAYRLEAGQVERAAKDLRKALPSFAEGRRNFRRRVVWLAAQVARKLGQTAEAEIALRQLVDRFLAAKLPYSAAVAAVELATVYFEQGRLREVRDLAASVYPVFAALGIDREALASLLLIRRAAEAETLNLELLRRLSQQADEAERHPPAPARARYERSAVKIFRT